MIVVVFDAVEVYAVYVEVGLIALDEPVGHYPVAATVLVSVEFDTARCVVVAYVAANDAVVSGGLGVNAAATHVIHLAVLNDEVVAEDGVYAGARPLEGIAIGERDVTGVVEVSAP